MAKSSARKATPEAAAKIYYDLPWAQRSFAEGAALLKQQTKETITARAFSSLVGRCENDKKVLHYVLHGEAGGDQALMPRSMALERSLMHQYGLQHAIVLACGDFYMGGNEGQEPPNDGNIHEELGKWAASLLLAYLRENDRIGVGSGRGPYCAVTAVELRASESLPRLKSVASLSGHISLGRPTNQNYDADKVASRLYSAIRSERCELVQYPLVKGQQGTAGVRFLHTEAGWKIIDPNVLLIGIGALAGGHRMLQEITDDLKPAKDRIKAIRDLRDVVEEHVRPEFPGYYCVGDICNRFFVVDPPAPVKGAAQAIKKLKEEVAEFNEQIFTIRFEWIQEVARKYAVIAVAGGPYKRYAVWYALKNKYITHLVTDDATANWLCDPARGLAGR